MKAGALAVLVVVVLVVAWGALLSTTYSWLFVDGQGRIQREKALWTTLELPRAAGVGAVAAITLIGSLRSLRRRFVLETVNGLAVGLLGAVAVIACLAVVHRPPPPEPPDPRVRPRVPSQAFIYEQWWAIGRLGPEGGRGTGRKGLSDPPDLPPGIIPFDPFLLDRVTFVGLTVAEVARVLGPGEEVPVPAPRQGTWLRYVAAPPDPYPGRGYLTLLLQGKPSAEEVIVAEYYSLDRVQY